MPAVPPDIERLEREGDVEGLIGALAEEEKAIRRAAAEALGKLGDPRALRPLVLYDARGDDLSLSPASLLVLKVGRHRLAPLLKDPDPRVRAFGAERLGVLGNAHDVGPLVEALGDEDQSVRRWAKRALERLGGPRAERALAEHHRAEERHRRESNAGFTVTLEDPGVNRVEVMKVLRDVAGLKNYLEAKEYLSVLPLEVYQGESKTRAEDVARKFRSAGATVEIEVARLELLIEPLLQDLASGDNWRRWSAVRKLADLGDARAVEPLMRELKRIDGEEGSARSQARQRYQEDQEHLHFARTADSEYDSNLRSIKDRYDRDRETVFDALNQIGGTEARQALADYRSQQSQEAGDTSSS